MSALLHTGKIGDDFLNICQNSECGQSFSKKTHNQKYCSDECCRTATNAKIMERYYEKKRRRAGERRVCSNQGCATVLSRYNDADMCSACTRNVMSLDAGLLTVITESW